ncbi:hypothetical protein M419DRAFT_7404 [Trichoderma reesei RUT C-30]|jgi:hypothetical protein|uniref:Uncharacterized protein n=1 Tax=Hypocrea jecorina (strain ATCC 56765 / BCRC 32924 / NRRL 11460 / Rut C-30) TaxID=1344414 RepID=A0A024SDU4_HYPJR|nr:hypothetical protein M419DRAFT_7404 [Trichoderma reesei RUT C-30]
MRKQGNEQLGLLEELELVHGVHQQMLKLLQDLGFSPPDGHQNTETNGSEADAGYDERRANIYKGYQDVVAYKEGLEKRIESVKKEDAKRRGQPGVQKKTTQARRTRRRGNGWTKAKKA